MSIKLLYFTAGLLMGVGLGMLIALLLAINILMMDVTVPGGVMYAL